MRGYSWIVAALSAALMASSAAAQDLPPEVMDNYAAFQTAAAEENWTEAAAAIQSAADAGDRLGIDTASRLVLWENLSVAHARAGSRIEALAAVRQTIRIAEEAGDPAVLAELLYRFMQRDLARNDQVQFLEHSRTFLDAVNASGEDFIDYERQVLTIRLALLEPQAVRSARVLAAQDERDIARLMQISAAGSVNDAIARRRLIWGYFASEQWDDALSATIEALGTISQSSDHAELSRANLHSLYHLIMLEGFGNVGDAASSLPETLRPDWCDALAQEPFQISNALPRINITSPGGEMLDVQVGYTVDGNGHVLEAIVDGADSRREARFGSAIEDAVRDWRWRPQCDPLDSYAYAGTVRFTHALHSIPGRREVHVMQPMTNRGRLFADQQTALMNGWRRN